MKITQPVAILASPGFVVAVALLILNDWILKDAFGSWWTGKLSDFAGLYALPLFWLAFLPRRKLPIFVLTAIGFLYWKSSLSDPALATWNALGLWPVTRVVDYTDWIALAVLVPAFRAAHHSAESPRRRWVVVARRAAATGMAAVAAVAFIATSTAPSYHYVFPAGSEYQIDGARAAVRAYFLAHEWEASRADLGATADTFSGGGAQCTRNSSRPCPDARVTLQDAAPCGTRVDLVDLESSDEDADVPAIQQQFEQEVIAPLRLLFPACSE